MIYLECNVSCKLWYNKAKLLYVFGFCDNLNQGRVEIN